MIHSRLFAEVSFINAKVDSTVDFCRAKRVLCHLYVTSSMIRPESIDQFRLSPFFPLRTGVEKSNPVRADRGTRRMFLNRFFRDFVQELYFCNEKYKQVDIIIIYLTYVAYSHSIFKDRKT